MDAGFHYDNYRNANVIGARRLNGTTRSGQSRRKSIVNRTSDGHEIDGRMKLEFSHLGKKTLGSRYCLGEMAGAAICTERREVATCVRPVYNRPERAFDLSPRYFSPIVSDFYPDVFFVYVISYLAEFSSNCDGRNYLNNN